VGIGGRVRAISIEIEASSDDEAAVSLVDLMCRLYGDLLRVRLDELYAWDDDERKSDVKSESIGRLFTKNDPEPTDVNEVADRDGDRWRRDGSTWTIGGNEYSRTTWGDLLKSLGPLTEVQ
jgi:hypothetical protein